MQSVFNLSGEDQPDFTTRRHETSTSTSTATHEVKPADVEPDDVENLPVAWEMPDNDNNDDDTDDTPSSFSDDLIQAFQISSDEQQDDQTEAPTPLRGFLQEEDEQHEQDETPAEQAAPAEEPAAEFLTTKLNSGITVLAKMTKYGLSAVGYSNRSQPEKKAKQLQDAGITAYVIQSGRPFYVRID